MMPYVARQPLFTATSREAMGTYRPDGCMAGAACLGWALQGVDKQTNKPSAGIINMTPS